nr:MULTISPECIES: CARDB domain-containing protein [Myxococcaceae]
MAVVALVGAPGDHAQAIARARANLEGLQALDGSWAGSVRLTAIAVRALASASPDWRVVPDESGRGVVLLSPTAPLQGQPVLASLDVENRSGFAAPAGRVRFVATSVAGGEPVVLAEAALAQLAGGARTHVTASLPTDGLEGAYTVQALVDPERSVVEFDELNNTASARMEVQRGSDLSVSNTSLSFVQQSGTQVRVDVTVRNVGSTLARDVAVDVYKGSVGGVRLGTATVAAGLASNASTTVSVLWDAAGANGATAIHAVVDPANVLAERDETNNAAFRFYDPGTSLPVDLAVVSAGITHAPGEVGARQPFTLRVQVTNPGANDANRVAVGVYESGGVSTQPLGLVELPSVPARGSAQAELQLALEKSTSLRVEVDPERRLNDTNRNNNSATHSVSVSLQPGVEVALDQLSANPSSAKAGETFALTATVRNSGREPVSSSVELVNQVDGRVWARLPVQLAGGDSARVDFGSLVRPAQAPSLRACVDVENALQEQNENDNCAELTVSPEAIQLSLQPEDLAFAPAGADVGERVHLSATVHNRAATAGSTVVEWWQGRPGLSEGRKLGESPLTVPASGSASASFDWLRKEGPVEVFAKLTRFSARQLTDSTTGTFAGRHLFLRELLKLDLGPAYAGVRYVTGQEVRVGRLHPGAAPDLVVGYRASVPVTLDPAGVSGGVVVYAPTAQGGHTLRWRHQALSMLDDVVLADLDGDGQGEVVVASERLSGTARTQRLSVLDADGQVKWSQDTVSNAGACWRRRATLGLADLDADGVSDLVDYDGERLRGFSGKDGHALVDAAPVPASCTGSPVRVDALDVDGDGDVELLVAAQQLFLTDHRGSLLWKRDAVSSAGEHAIVDLDLDGQPELVIPVYRGALEAYDLRTGNRKWQGVAYEASDRGMLAAALRQDGLSYPAVSNNSTQPNFAAFSPELQTLWNTPIVPFESTDVSVASAADLLGLGRPQLLPQSLNRGLFLLDGRSGRPLTAFPSPMPVSGGAIDGDLAYSDRQVPVVAALGADAEARAEVVVSRSSDCLNGDGAVWEANQFPVYGCNQVLVYASPHWKKLPSTWPTRSLRRGQVGDDLRVSPDLRWWLKPEGNTYNQQFDKEPSRLLADLALAATPLTALPAQGRVGAQVQLTANVRNVGGLSASDVRVVFYDGDPAQGGKRLGEARAAGPLAPRTGQAAASLLWDAYPEGEHRIWAVVNPEEAEGAIEESGHENNTASFRLFVGAGTAVCDLALDAASLQASPAAPAAGAPVSLAASVRNVGQQACAASALEVKGQGRTALPALAAGEAARVAVQLTALPSQRQLQLAADPEGLALDGDRSNNQAVFLLDVADAQLPDLVAQLVSLSPRSAREGERVSVQATVRNQGASAPAAAYRFVMDGAVVQEGVLPALLDGESVALSAELSAPSASNQVLLEVDPADQVPEFLETNNRAALPLAVEASGLALAVAANPASAGPETAIAGEVQLTNVLPSAREVWLSARALAEDGTVLGTLLPATQLLLEPQGGARQPLSWNTGRLPPGTYRLVAEATESGRLLARAEARVAVTGAAGASTEVVTDRGVYAPGRDVLISQRTSNLSLNTWLNGATVRVTVRDAAGAQLLASTRPVPPLPPAGHFDTNELFALSASLPPGTYTVQAEVRDAQGGVMDSREATFALQYAAEETVRAAVSVRSPFPLGPTLPVKVTLSNTGALPVAGRTLKVRLLDAAALAEQGAAAQGVDVPAGGTAVSTLSVPTAAVTEGQKLLVVELDGRTLERVLVSAALHVDTTPPTIRVAGVSDGQATNAAAVTPDVQVEDESRFSALMTLDGLPYANGTPVSAEGTHVLAVEAVDVEGNASELQLRFTLDRQAPALLLAGVAQGAVVHGPVTLTFSASDALSVTLKSTLDGTGDFSSGTSVSAEGDHLWTVTATDAAGNSATASRAFALDTTPPTLQVAGVSAGASYRLPVQPTVQVTDAHPGTTTVRVDGSPLAPGAQVSAEGPHTLEVEALDAAGNRTAQQLAFTLDFTLPELNVTGVSEGQVAEGFTITFAATDAALLGVSATLDGSPFNSGDTVSAPGAHELRVRAEDRAGNVREQRIGFTVKGGTLPRFDYAVCALNNLAIKDRANLSAAEPGQKASAGANGAANILSTAHLGGDFVVGGSLSLQGASGVDGRAYYGNQLAVARTAKLALGSERVTPAPSPCGCGYDVQAAMLRVRESNDNAKLQTLPESSKWLWWDGGLVVRGKRTLLLPSGRYFLPYVWVDGTSTLGAAPGAHVELYVEGSFAVSGDSRLQARPAEGSSLVLVSAADLERNGDYVTVPHAGDIALQVYAPTANLDLASNGRIFGAVVANEVAVRGSQALVQTPAAPAGAPRLRCE